LVFFSSLLTLNKNYLEIWDCKCFRNIIQVKKGRKRYLHLSFSLTKMATNDKVNCKEEMDTTFDDCIYSSLAQKMMKEVSDF